MAGISGWLTIESIDANRVPFAERIYFKNTSDVIADTTLFANGLLPLYDAVISGQIQTVWLHIPMVLPGGLKGAPVSGGNNTVGALEKFDTALSGEPYSYWFPSWVPAGFESAHQNIVDQSQADVANFNAYLLAISHLTQVADEDNNVLAGAAPLLAIKSDRKQRRALRRVR